MDIRLGRDITGELSQGIRREWLVTNGLGGYAMGTVAGVRSRCYHGLLIAPLVPPAKRHLMLAAADMWIDINGRHLPLVTHEWSAGVILPDGYNHLEQFRLEGSIPVFRWGIGVINIEQRIWMAHGENTTYVTWHYKRGLHPVRLILKPLISYRSHHDITAGGTAVSVHNIPEIQQNGVALDILPAEYLGLNLGMPVPMPFRIFTNKGRVIDKEDWWWSFRLSAESARGMLDQEDLYNAAVIEVTLNPGETLAMIATAETYVPQPWEEALAAEQQRQNELLVQARVADEPDWIKQLVLAADQFIVEYDDPRSTHEKSIINGYPWFGVWGRMALVSLDGLTLATRRFDVARGILESFARYNEQGLLPNLLSDDTGHPEYNAVDVTLWYFVALWLYLQHQPDDIALLEKLYPEMESMLNWYIKGTRYRVQVDPEDGLLAIGEQEIPLTWMDVRMNKQVVTPRNGKVVEINALWYNALCIMAACAEKLNKQDDAKKFQAMADKHHASFNNRFWCEEKGYLYDYIDSFNAKEPFSSQLRPNQLFALSLPFRILEDDERARRVVDICAHELLVSYGLRTLARKEPGYRSRYDGTIEERDKAYHQGVAWAWLLGPFVRAYYTVYGDAEGAMSFLEPLIAHLSDYGVGQIAEIFDSDSPYHARGAVAYASSVAELLRMWDEFHRAPDEKKLDN